MIRGPALLLAAAACVSALPSVTGRQAFPDPVAADLKTRAVRSARTEIARATGNGLLVQGLFLDTLVGPTPENFLYEWAHPAAWRAAMIANHLVDGEFGVPGRRSGLPHTVIALEIGDPFPAGADSAGVVYAWCQRSFPTSRSNAGPATSWRDTYLRSDTGWTMVGHRRIVAPTACTG